MANKTPDPNKPKSRRGFAAMSAEMRAKIASRGGRAVRAEDRSFSKDPELARKAGQKGGLRNRKK
jgi:general stress protein YciG